MGDNMIIIGFIAIVIILILSIVIFVKDRKNDNASAKAVTSVLANINKQNTNNKKEIIYNYFQKKYKKVPRDGIEPPTRGFSVLCSTD